MVIKKQPIISWLLNTDSHEYDTYLWIPFLKNRKSIVFLNESMDYLKYIRDKKPVWGLPVLLRSPFVEVMKKSGPSFVKSTPQLFQEFCKSEECGILISKDHGTIVFGFGENELYVWLFLCHDGKSLLRWHFCTELQENGTLINHTNSALLDEKQLFTREIERKEICDWLSSLILLYLAVKKHGKVETVIAPPKAVIKLENALQSKGQESKVRNDSDQEVIVMDSRWFRKIVNDNEISVDGFYRHQRKKNAAGEIYKELIYIKPHVRHGYHRNASIEDIGNQ